MKTITKLLPAMLIATVLAAPAYATTFDRPQSGLSGMMPGALEGKQIIGMNGDRLGYVLAVNTGARTIDLQTPGGIAVSMPESRLRLFGGELVAINTTRGDVLAMERRQTGRTVAVNIDLRNDRVHG